MSYVIIFIFGALAAFTVIAFCTANDDRINDRRTWDDSDDEPEVYDSYFNKNDFNDRK